MELQGSMSTETSSAESASAGAEIRSIAHRVFVVKEKPSFCQVPQCLNWAIAFWPNQKIWLCGKHLELIPAKSS